jgi:cobalt-zinc-cadmium efflux system outer membrane protein
MAALDQMALQRNPTLAQAAANVEDARGRAVQSGLYPNPTVGYVGDQIGLRGKAAPGEMQGVFVDQTIVTGGKLELNRARFQQEVTQMELEALAQRYRVVNGIRARFYQLLAMRRQVAIREEFVKTAEDIVTTAEELVNVGQANKPDLLQARIEARQARVALANARALAEAAGRQLAAFVGDPRLPLDRLQGDLEEGAALPGLDATLAHLLEASPEIQSARAEVARGQIALRREQVEPIPNVNVRVASGYNSTEEARRVTTSVQVGVRLPVFDRNQGNIYSAQAQLARAQAEVGRVELDLTRRLSRAYARYETARAVVEAYRKDSLPEAREAFELYRDSFNRRRAAYPQVLIAQRNFFQIGSEYVDALDRLRRAEVEIRGLLLTDGTAEPPGPPGEGRFRRRESERGPGEDLPDPIPPGGRPLDERLGQRPGGGE